MTSSRDPMEERQELVKETGRKAAGIYNELKETIGRPYGTVSLTPIERYEEHRKRVETYTVEDWLAMLEEHEPLGMWDYFKEMQKIQDREVNDA